jgi:hypothetical protein
MSAVANPGLVYSSSLSRIELVVTVEGHAPLVLPVT